MLIRYSREALKFLNKLVLAWDPDYTKMTAEEELRIDAAEKVDLWMMLTSIGHPLGSKNLQI